MKARQIEQYGSLSGELQKLASNFFIGYQKKFFCIFQNGSKIAYRNLEDTAFEEKNIFNIKQVFVCQAQQQFTFSLETPKKNFIIRAPDEITKVRWIKAVTKLRKQIIRKKFKHNSSLPKRSIPKSSKLQGSTQPTQPNGSLTIFNQTTQSINYNQQITHRSNRMSARVMPNPQKDQVIKQNYKTLFKNMSEQFIKFNTYVTTLKNKVENLFNTNFQSFTYLIFSSKSLYPTENLCEQNMTNMMLPQWAEVNKVYKIPSETQMPKLCFQISKILSIEGNPEQFTQLKVRTDQNVFSFFCQTVQQKNRLEKIMNVAVQNYKQVCINGKLSKKNYDNLIWLFNNDRQEFLERVAQIISKYIPNNHQYEPEVVIKIIDVLIPFIQDFVAVLKNKIKDCTEVILNLLKVVHEQVKVHIKLTWDTSYTNMRGEHILNFLNALSAYHSVIKDYITDIQFMIGMKELSKVYVRQSWKNFEDIILSIVQEETKNNYFQDQDNEYIETNSITDLFKFMNEVCQLAAPCWAHKLHLHNVQKLMYRALSVFITEMKSSVDEAVITNKQLIAIANNYFHFSLTVDEFYNERFSTLQEKTKQSYDRLKVQYKDLSHIILDKLAFDTRSQLRLYLQKTNYFKISVDKIFQILKQSSQNTQVSFLHSILSKRFYQKIFSGIREGILYSLQREISSKKKQNMKKITDQLDSLIYQIVEAAGCLSKGQGKIQKQLNQVNLLLSSQDHKQLLTLIRSSGQDIKKAYMKQHINLYQLTFSLLNLRQDYYIGGPLYFMINEQTIQRNSLATIPPSTTDIRCTTRRTLLTISKQQQNRVSFSGQYKIDKEQMQENSQISYQQPVKLISQGYLMKCKNNKKVWEKIYFRLKNSCLYFYQNEKSQRCLNSIKVEEMSNIFIPTQGSANFGILYYALGREKEIEFRCQTVELRDRWMQSLGLELRRIRNQVKVKKQPLELTQKKKNQMIIDYEELMNGKQFFSYSSTQ